MIVSDVGVSEILGAEKVAAKHQKIYSDIAPRCLITRSPYQRYLVSSPSLRLIKIYLSPRVLNLGVDCRVQETEYSVHFDLRYASW